MRVRWRGFELPTRISVEEETRTDTYAKFITEPFQRGFGTTVGNGLRRVLLSSLEGAAVTHVKFDGIDHEYATIPGVYEDVTDLILNLKDLLVRLLPGTHSAVLRIDTDKVGEVTAGDLVHDHTVEVVNPGMHIARITEAARLKAEIHVQRGRGYRTAEENQPGVEQEIGVIPVASFFSPVKRVRYRTENTRVGQLTNYDKLVLEIWTDGTVTPENALVEAAKILRKHLNPFIHFFDLGKELKPEFGEEEETPAVEGVRVEAASRDQLSMQFSMPVTELDLSVRAQNCLESENIRTIGELVRMKEEDLVKLRNFGRVTLKEIEKKLTERGLRLGMTEEVDSILANR
ncbi:MAG: DNA-directed RNA polymerase subunit alpha [Planctomycetes bacterium]|nr:DNA-directed RNA polymerase subunit alpha [Planctomycetota bacterium]MCW8138920.1 DNA-directed RNA polymerase subunit alpha [Planctomycetota bacterium]